MKDEERTKSQLSAELQELRRKVARLEEAEERRGKARDERGEYYRHIEELVEERTAEIRIVNRQLQGEIESRRRAEEALQVVAGQWRDTLDAISDAVWLMDLDQTVVRCNKAAAKLFKKDYSGIVGKKCFSLIHGTSNPVEGCPFLRMYKSRRKETVYLKSGNRWFNVSVTPLRDKTSRIVGAVHVVSDVTKERQLREEIKESKKKIVDMLESITDGFFAVDRECRFVYVNKRTEKLLRKSPQELMGTSILEVVPGEFGATVHMGCLHALKKGKPVVLEAFSSSPPGWVEVRAYPSVAGLAVYFQDVTERKSVEERLRESEAKYRDLFYDTKDAVFIADRDGRLLDANQPLLDLFGYSKQELGRMALEDTHVNVLDRKSYMEKIEPQGFVRDYEVRLKKKDGTAVTCLITASVRWGRDGEVLGYQGIIRKKTEPERDV
jgi:PAS domain S-box-containing protein